MASQVFANDPFAKLLAVFERLFPLIPVGIIQWDSTLPEGAFGRTVFPDDGSHPVISIDPNQTIMQALDILAHELSHVACESLGLDHPVTKAQHRSGEKGRFWREIYGKLNEEYVAKMEGGN